MHLKRLYQTVTKVMCHWINRTCGALPLLILHRCFTHTLCSKKCIIFYYRSKQRLCLPNAGYKFCNLTSFIHKDSKSIFKNNISSKFIMLTYNNQIFRNCFVIIHYHLTKVSARINRCIIFEPNELPITLSTLYYTYLPTT